MENGKTSERRELWRQRISEQEKSGTSIRAYCRQHEIAEHAFYAWRSGLRADKTVTFALVEAKPAVTETRMVELVLAQGERLLIPCEESVLRMIFGVLREQP